MSLRNWTRGLGLAGVAGLAGLLTVGLTTDAALAQKKAKKPSTAWVKLCEKATFTLPPKVKNGKPRIEKKDICLSHHERLDGRTGLVVVSAAIRQVSGQKKQHLMIMVPLGMALPPGVLVKVDDQKKPLKLRFSLCHPSGCTAETEATADMISRMRKGNVMAVAAFNVTGKPVVFRVPLTGFAKTYSGKPIDNKKYADARRALMKQLAARRRAFIKSQREKRGAQPAPKQ
ncbi:MAG: invasion associated locus B family protein [Pseudomonadota bacterium]